MQYRISQISPSFFYNETNYIPVYDKQLQDCDVHLRDQELIAAFVNTTAINIKINIIQMNLKDTLIMIYINLAFAEFFSKFIIRFSVNKKGKK